MCTYAFSISRSPFHPISNLLVYCTCTAESIINTQISTREQAQGDGHPERKEANYFTLINANKQLLLHTSLNIHKPLLHTHTVNLCWQCTFFCCLLVAAIIGGVVGSLAFILVVVIVVLVVRHKFPGTQGERCKNPTYYTNTPVYVLFFSSLWLVCSYISETSYLLMKQTLWL